MSRPVQQIATIISTNPELIAEIELAFERVENQKGTKVLQAGNRANYLYFIEKGILHNYYYHDTRQVTSWFYAENEFVTSWHSFYAQKSSFEEIECLEDCVLHRLSYANYKRLIATYPAFNNFTRQLAEEALAFVDEFSKGWSFLSAKEKYRLLKEHFPEIELRVKLGLIASFLGITQETLSRIRTEK